ncbi:nuclear transport factor 2 family protein [Novosphingobium lentum]|uniref:nuclear transport factor 2 family protein n=1 Tax=Novosphingobium lentum TaxID=145287 RepID=UPI0008351A03|nr:nuclear transport factor 2 family protein [Novosphingobium lentum]
MTLEELSAREAIKDVKARYCYHIDLKHWDEYAGLFTADAIMDVDQSVSTRGRPANPTPRITGSAAIRTFMPQMLDNADTVHQVHSPIIELTSPTTAKAIWAMEDIVKMPGFHLEARGHYHETYALVGGKWYIASLHLTRTLINILEGTEAGPDLG